MTTIKKITGYVSIGLGALLLSIVPVKADSIIKFGLGESTSPDLKYESGVFSTVDFGDASTVGDQNTALSFSGYLEGLQADIASGASITISNVFGVGTAFESITLGTISQQTAGGSMSIWDDNNDLLLSAELGEGVIVGAMNVPTASLFNTEFVNFTGGSLLSFISPFPGNISLSMASILSGVDIGLLVKNDGTLADFTAIGNGLVTGTGTQIPEPSTVLLMMSGIMGAAMKRRKQKISDSV